MTADTWLPVPGRTIGQDSIMNQQPATQPAVPVTSTDVEPEPQPCYICHTLVPPIYDGGIPYYVCPESQTTACLDRAKLLRAEKGAEITPEET